MQSYENQQYLISERSAIGRGEIYNARYYHKINKLHKKYGTDQLGRENWRVLVEKYKFEGKYNAMENILKENGKVAEAIEIYEKINKWDDAIRLCKENKVVNVKW